MFQLGWFSTARGPTSQALLAAAWNAIKLGDISAEIAFVFCSRERGESAETDKFLDQAEGYGIPLITLSFTRFRETHGGHGMGLEGTSFASWRKAYDKEVLRLLNNYHPDLAVLAGYMLVMTPELCLRLPTINLHPAAPGGPAGTWQQVIWELIENRAANSGIRMHLVTPALDEGPIISFCTYSLQGDGFGKLWNDVKGADISGLRKTQGEEHPLFVRIRQEGIKRELPMILATIKAFSQGRIRVRNGALLDGGGSPITAYDLTEEIEAALASKSASL